MHLKKAEEAQPMRNVKKKKNANCDYYSAFTISTQMSILASYMLPEHWKGMFTAVPSNGRVEGYADPGPPAIQ